MMMTATTPTATLKRWAIRLLFQVKSPPRCDQERIVALRQLAGMAVHRYTNIPYKTSAGLIQQLRDASAELRHYPGIYQASRDLTDMCRLIVREQGTLDEFYRISDRARRAYDRLMRECVVLLGSGR